MNSELTSKEYWEEIWRGTTLPVVRKPHPDVDRLLKAHLPQGDWRFCEVGCSPGGWMAYFHLTFGYSLTGVDYLDFGVELCARNLAMQGIPATVLRGDVLDLRLACDRFDVVFTGGLIEHFTDPMEICRRLADLSRGYVVTTVPNLYGINGMAIRKFRAEDFSIHTRIDRRRLRFIHESSGIETVFCDYTGGAQLLSITERSEWFAGRRFLAAVTGRSLDLVNSASARFSKISGLSPRWRLVSPSLIYIGRVARSGI